MGKSSIPAVTLILFLAFEAAQADVGSFREDSVEVAGRKQAGDSIAPGGEATGELHGLRIESAGLRLGAGELREPLGLAADAAGFVYAADAMTGKVFRYSRDGESLEFDRPALFASLYPIDIAVFGPFVYVLDYDENKVLRYDTKGAYLDILLSFDEYERMHPASLTTGEGGRIVTTDIENHNVTVWTPLLDTELSIGEYGWEEGMFDRPMKAVILPDERIAVVESGNRRVQVFSPAGSFEGILLHTADGGFRSPRSISSDVMGNIFVADAAAGRVFVFSPEWESLLDVGSYEGEAISPAALTVGWDDFLYVADLKSRSILVFRLLYP